MVEGEGEVQAGVVEEASAEGVLAGVEVVVGALVVGEALVEGAEGDSRKKYKSTPIIHM